MLGFYGGCTGSVQTVVLLYITHHHFTITIASTHLEYQPRVDLYQLQSVINAAAVACLRLIRADTTTC